MIHVYTYGRGSRQFLILTEKQADLINLFTRAFFEAQKHFLEKEGRRWTPSDPISFNGKTMSRRKMNKYNKLVYWLNLQHKIRNWLFTLFHIDVSNEDMDDYLIKRF
jgi:hypothetical protein